MSRAAQMSAFVIRKILPWALAALVPAACASAGEEEVGEQSSALTTTHGVDADAHVRSTATGTNYGSATALLADGNDGGATLQTYIRFTVPNVSGISSAKLRLRCINTTNGDATHFYEVRRVTSTSWSESGLTWSNKPALGTILTTFQDLSSGTWLEIDVTSLAAPGAQVSLAIVPNNITDGVDFSSRSASSNQPQLVITTADGSGGSGGTGGTGGTGAVSTGPSTDPNLKIAFVGDTGDGANWGSVLQLIQREQAHAILVQGDMTYDSDPSGWWSRTEGIVGQSFPVFIARGNHDDGTWSGFQAEANNHLGGATRTNVQSDSAYLTVFRGLAVGTIRKGDTAARVDAVFGSNDNIWKVCAWHQNQLRMQVGGKGDEMGWEVYERCRGKGAIIQTAHEHTYHRTKTMTNTQNQVIDSSCSSGSTLCVGPGRTFVTVSGLGGNSVRSQVRCTPTSTAAPFPSLNTSDSSCPIWASIYTSNQGATLGAQFITFNVDGNPKKARGYFKNVNNVTIDSFTIFRD